MDTTWDCIVVGGRRRRSERRARARPRPAAHARRRRRRAEQPRRARHRRPARPRQPPAGRVLRRRARGARAPTRRWSCGRARSSTASAHDAASRSSWPTARASARAACCSPRGWTTASPRCPGIAERWGRSVFHCPFCHGWEVRDRALGVLDRGATGVHAGAAAARVERRRDAASRTGPPSSTPTSAERLAAAGVAVDERRVAGLRGPGRHADGRRLRRRQRARVRRAARAGHAAPALRARRAARRGRRRAGAGRRRRGRGRPHVPAPACPGSLRRGRSGRADAVRGQRGRRGLRGPRP